MKISAAAFLILFQKESQGIVLNDPTESSNIQTQTDLASQERVSLGVTSENFADAAV